MTYKPTPLCRLAYKYGTDKCPLIRHSYTPFYYQMFAKDRGKIKKVLEIGIGYYPGIQKKAVFYDKILGRTYHRGASLLMWRDFFPKAIIYGADIRPETLFQDERIKTFLCDERKKENLENLVKHTGGDIDIFIDDASHRWQDQVLLAKNILPLLKKDVIYVIEDVGYPDRVVEGLKDYEHLDPELPLISHLPQDKLLVIKSKNEYYNHLLH